MVQRMAPRRASTALSVVLAATVLGWESQGVPAQSPADGPMPVTVETFVRAETDMFFGLSVKDGALGKFFHRRAVMGIDDQFVVRGNRDTLYSIGVFDLDAGPVTITIPDSGKRFLALQIIDQDQYVPAVHYGAGSYTLSKESIGTRYVGTAVRILADPQSEADIKAVWALQDAIRVEQKGGPGRFEIPAWDQASQKKVRDALLVLAETLPDTQRAFGARGEVDPIRRLISAASAWGGNPEKDALYLNITPAKNDGRTVYTLDVKDVPVDGFWSISVYGPDGYFKKNDLQSYTLNNIIAHRTAGETVSVQFGGCDGKMANCLPVVPGWNYMVRLYRSRPEVLNGQWNFPDAVPAN